MTSNEPEWCGWSVGTDTDRVAVHVGPLPGRKAIAVYTATTTPTGTAVHVRAYCRSVADGEALLAAVTRLALAPS